MAEPVTFLASFPPIQSAIKVGQDGARIQLDIPETELPAIARLLLLRGVVLRVTIKVEKSLGDGRSKAKSRAARRPTDVAGG